MIAGTGFEKKRTNPPVYLEECSVEGLTIKSIDMNILHDSSLVVSFSKIYWRILHKGYASVSALKGKRGE